MSLLNFFAKQRLAWQRQPTPQSPDFLLGGYAALDQAQAAFQAEPLLNYLHENHRLQLEMEDLGYQLSRTRAQAAAASQENSVLRFELAAANSVISASKNRIANIRKRVAKLSQAAFDLVSTPEWKLRKLQDLISAYADLANRDSLAISPNAASTQVRAKP